MTMDIIVSDEVLMDYPRMKLSQDARLTYLKTIVHAGNQLNGIRRKLQSLQKDTLLQLSKELKPLFQTKQKGSLQGLSLIHI